MVPDRFVPLILVQRDGEDRLTGLLALAEPKEAGPLIAAGGNQAEYQVWLARGSQAESFIEEAMESLRSRYAGQTLTLRYLPPGTPLGWVGKGRPWATRSVLTETFRPIVRREDAQQVAKHKKRYKNKANQLRQLGSLQFAELTDAASIRSAFDDLISQHDLRRGSAYGETPFQDDKRRRPFLLALMEIPGLLHVTVTTVGEEIIAGHIGLRDSKAVYGWVMCHAPSYERQSAGMLHMTNLIERAIQDASECFDLTPGPSPWKDRLMARTEPVHELTVAFRRSTLIREKAKMAGRALVRSGLQRLRVEPLRLKEALADSRRRGWWDMLAEQVGRGSRWIHARQQICLYMRDCRDLEPRAAGVPLQRDHLADLVAFEPEGRLPRGAFFRDAWQRLATGSHVYTWVESGRLLHSAWVGASEDYPGRESIQAGGFPQGTAIVYDFYTAASARGRGLCQATLGQILAQLVAEARFQRIGAVIPAGNRVARHIVEKAGFRHVQSIFATTRFGASRSAAEAALPESSCPVKTVADSVARDDCQNKQIEIGVGN
jgi:CelD/BcsL family acetyltransferase involved in cellulose biosynthesis